MVSIDICCKQGNPTITYIQPVKYYASLINLFFFPLFRAVKFTSKLFGRALSKRIKATVLYASETGKSEQYAKQLCELLGHAFNAQVDFEINFPLLNYSVY